MSTKKQKRVVAREMFAITASSHLSECHLSDLMAFKSEAGANAVVNRKLETIAPIIVLPADAASYAKMVEQMGYALTCLGTSPKFRKLFKATDESTARTMLAAIGIKEPRR